MDKVEASTIEDTQGWHIGSEEKLARFLAYVAYAPGDMDEAYQSFLKVLPREAPRTYEFGCVTVEGVVCLVAAT